VVSIRRILFVVEVSGAPGTAAPRGAGSVTTITVPTTVETSHPIRRATLASGGIAAVAVTVAAAAADAAGVPFAIDGETIPLAGFAQMTLVGAVLGGLIAAACRRFAARPGPAFVAIAVMLTAVSCIPSVAMPPDVATKIVLVALHVLAAAIVIPALDRALRA
jgi:hypothetical protein